MSCKQIILWIYNTYMERLQYNHLVTVTWSDHQILFHYDPLKQTAATLAAAWFSLNCSAALACFAIINHTLVFSWTLKSVKYSKIKMPNNALYIHYSSFTIIGPKEHFPRVAQLALNQQHYTELWPVRRAAAPLQHRAAYQRKKLTNGISSVSGSFMKWLIEKTDWCKSASQDVF